MTKISDLITSSGTDWNDYLLEVEAAAGTASRSTTVRRLVGAHNVLHYGATGDGTTDDTAAIALAVTAACTAGGALYFPAGTYLVAGSGSAIFTLTAPIEVYGDGYDSWIKPTAAVPTSRDVFLLSPTGTGSKSYALFRRLRIEGAAAGVARYGINVKPLNTGQALTRVGVDGVAFANLSSFAVYYDGSGGATPSIHNCWVRNIQVTGNGFGATTMADSTLIENCRFGGTGYAVDVASFQGGAGKFTLRNCSVTATSGVRVGGAITGLQIHDNFFEVLATYDGANNAYVDLNGASGSVIAAPVISGNLIVVLSAFGDPDGLRLNWCDDAVVEGNRFNITPTGSDAIAITSNANRAHVDPSNSYLAGGGGRWSNSGSLSSGGSKYLCNAIASSSAITNTTDETAYSIKFTVPANYLKIGQAIRVRASGVFSTTGTPTLTHRVLVNPTSLGPPVSGGSSVFVKTLTANNNATSDPWMVETQFVIRSASAGQRGGGFAYVGNSTGAGPDIAASMAEPFGVDLTVALNIYVTADWSAASSSNTTTMRTLLVELIDATGAPN